MLSDWLINIGQLCVYKPVRFRFCDGLVPIFTVDLPQLEQSAPWFNDVWTS